MNWTTEQKQAIEEKGNNILVAAGAGSGKTAVLVERIIKKLIDDKIDVDNLLVVTFTNAAASQMREKILEAIYKKLEEQPENKHLQRQIILMNKSNISTIHSFCLDVIRNHFYEISISPNFRMGDSSELEILKQEVLDELFEEKYEKKDELFLKLTEIYTNYKGDDELKELVHRIYNFIQSTPFPEEWLKEAVNKFNVDIEDDFGNTIWGKILLKNINDEIDGYILELTALEKKLNYEGLSKYELVIAADKQLMNEIKGVRSWQEAHVKTKDISFQNWPVDRKIISNLKDEAKQKRNKIKENFKSTIESMSIYSSKEAMEDIVFMKPILNALSDLVIEFSKKYKEEKKQRNIIDFHDIEHFALQILINKKEDGTYCKTKVAEQYMQKFEEIAIDEYQDSNLIQDYILNTISRGNNLFMVGDVKQSIYKFRQARPSLFLEKYNKYVLPKEGIQHCPGIKIPLFTNFRSRKEVLNITNEVFFEIMSEKLGEIEYVQSEYLNLGAKFEETVDKPLYYGGKPELYIIDTNIDEADELLENSELEAKLVSKKIKELIDGNYQVKEKDGYRKVEYRDIVILLRSANTVANVYEEELTRQNIPVFSDTGSNYLESTEITTILSILKVIDNPNQDIALVTVLRSPIYNFDDNDLIQIRLHDKNSSFYEALKKAKDNVDTNLNKKIHFFLEQMDLYKQKQEYMPLHEFVWYLYETTGYMSYICMTPNGILKMANLKMLFQRAKDYEKASFKGVYNFVQFMERIKKNNQDLGSAKIIGENENVVRIMSIHKSKGLEFPIVFLCGTGKGFNFKELNENILLHQDNGFGPRYVNYERQIEYNTLAKEAIRRNIKVEAISEEMRILYVALTRAKEKIIIVGTQKDVKKNLDEKKELLDNLKTKGEKLPHYFVKKYKTYLDWLELVLLNEKNENVKYFIYNQSDIEKKDEYNNPKQEENKFKISKEIKEKIKKEIEWEYKNIQLTVIPSKTSVTAIKQEENKDDRIILPKCELKTPIFLTNQKKLTGAQRGTIIHFVLQKLDLKMNYTLEQLKDFIFKMQANGMLTQEEVSVIPINKIARFLNSDLGKQIKMAKEIYKEKPFYLYLPASQVYGGTLQEKIVVQGIIDLYFRNEQGKIVLVDYKTDFIENNDDTIIIKKYKGQIGIYKKAIEDATGEKVDKSYIYSTYLDKTILVE